MRLLIGINGPIGSGKSWLANKISESIKAQFDYEPDILGLNSIVRDKFFKEFPNSELDYAKYKDAIVDSRTRETGRDRIIAYAEGKRKEDLGYWTDRYVNELIRRKRGITINDSIGFQSEWDYLIKYSGATCLLIGIGGTRTYGLMGSHTGERFPGDSRRRVGNAYIFGYDSDDAWREVKTWLVPYLQPYVNYENVGAITSPKK